MTTLEQWMGTGEPDHLESFTRLRAQTRPDPYNPHAPLKDWALPTDDLPLRGAWASGSSSFGSDPVREQQTTTKRITVFDPGADVHEGDRIRTEDGALFVITGRPERDRSPWTGWQPTLVIAVEEVKG